MKFSSLEIARELLLGGSKSQPSNEFAAVARLLIADRDAAWERITNDHSQSSNREFVRVTFAAIEGLLWQLKQHILRDPEKISQLSIHEHAALLEESYTVDDRGKVRAQPRFLSIGSSIRLVTHILQKFQPEFTLDFSNDPWRHVKEAVQIRNRLVHPKHPSDLDVSNADVVVCHVAFLWFSAFTLFVLEVHKGTWRDIETQLKDAPVPNFFRRIKTDPSEPRDGEDT